MSLLDKIGEFTRKKVVAPAMLFGLGLGLYQGTAQEITKYNSEEVRSVSSYLVDIKNSGSEDMLKISKNPYENQLEIHYALRNKSEFHKYPTHMKTWNVKSTPPSFYTFTIKDSEGFNDIYIATAVYNSQKNANELKLYKIDNDKGALSETVKEISDIGITIPEKTTFSVQNLENKETKKGKLIIEAVKTIPSGTVSRTYFKPYENGEILKEKQW